MNKGMSWVWINWSHVHYWRGKWEVNAYMLASGEFWAVLKKRGRLTPKATATLANSGIAQQWARERLAEANQ